MRSDQQAAWIPALGIAVLDNLKPGLVKTSLPEMVAGIAYPDMGCIDLDHLPGMGAKTLAIDGDTDD
jgi:ABC-type molybdate transport system ATPase subunit